MSEVYGIFEDVLDKIQDYALIGLSDFFE